MKRAKLLLTVSIGVILGTALTLRVEKDKRPGSRIATDRVDLPEEYKAISPDSLRPDTLTAYRVNGVIYLGFHNQN
jgi:hypothetical protein